MSSGRAAKHLMGVVAVLAIASEALAQSPAAAPRRSIEVISGGVYTATNNNHLPVTVGPRGPAVFGNVNRR